MISRDDLSVYVRSLRGMAERLINAIDEAGAELKDCTASDFIAYICGLQYEIKRLSDYSDVRFTPEFSYCPETGVPEFALYVSVPHTFARADVRRLQDALLDWEHTQPMYDLMAGHVVVMVTPREDVDQEKLDETLEFLTGIEKVLCVYPYNDDVFSLQSTIQHLAQEIRRFKTGLFGAPEIFSERAEKQASVDSESFKMLKEGDIILETDECLDYGPGGGEIWAPVQPAGGIGEALQASQVGSYRRGISS